MATVKTEVYSPREIARAAGVPLDQVVAVLGSPDLLVSHDEAVRVGRALVAGPGSAIRGGTRSPIPVSARAPVPDSNGTGSRAPLFSAVDAASASSGTKGVSFAVSSTVHAGVVAGAILLTTVTITPQATTLREAAPPAEPLRLVYLNVPGPGGGGGGGGRRQPAPPPKALREGRARISSPVPIRRPPPRIEPVAKPPDPPPPPLNSEPLPVLVAPIVTAPADNRTRIGVFEQAQAQSESHGPGRDGGAGTGAGTGLGPGDGSGLGPGSGGGTGGGPFRPGSGIEAPRLLREIKADYTEDARRRGLEGEVVMEIIVTRNGTVGEVKILKRLGAGLDERAAQAVRQWRFAPATRKGTAVDVVVEVSVEFKLR
jgi:TonB family protein